MRAIIKSFCLTARCGSEAEPVTLDVEVSGLKGWMFNGPNSGLQPHSWKELIVRTQSALEATGRERAIGGRIHVMRNNEQPLPAGASVALDLPVALALLGLADQCDGLLVAGELALSGVVRPIRGALAMAQLARRLGMRGVLVPEANIIEAQAVLGVQVYAIDHIAGADRALAAPVDRVFSRAKRPPSHQPDFADVRGQEEALAAVESAVVAGKNLLLSGPPGVGKTMIARRVPSVFPRMTREESIVATLYYSAQGLAGGGLIEERPFRAPHHTISQAALCGTDGRPGEVQLAACGVLFLDQLEEFSIGTLEALARALGAMPEAERPMLVAATSSCPCGTASGHEQRTCNCSPDTLGRWHARMLRIERVLDFGVKTRVQCMPLDAMRDGEPGEASHKIRERVQAALVARKGGAS